MTSLLVAGVMLLALSAAAFAEGPNPDAVTKSVSQCPAAQAAFAKLASLKEPAETRDKSQGMANSCSYIATLRSGSDAYVSELHKCAAHGLRGLNAEIQRVQALMSTLPETPQICDVLERAAI